MPTVLRLVYSRFAAQEMLADKLEEPEEEPPSPAGHEYSHLETHEMGTNPDADDHQLMSINHKPALEV